MSVVSLNSSSMLGSVNQSEMFCFALGIKDIKLHPANASFTQSNKTASS